MIRSRAFGMPAAWPVFFEFDQAYRLKPGFAIQSEVVSRYPAQGAILAPAFAGRPAAPREFAVMSAP